jgi:uncharacterized protein YndB with AHSA1/START domain
MKTTNDYGKFTGPAEVRLVRLLPGPIERIWEYLTDPEKRSRWVAGGVIEPRQGGKVTLHFLHRNLAPDETPPEDYKNVHENGMTMEGTVLRYEPPRALAYTFGSTGESEVLFELIPQGSQVRLVVTHRSRGGDIPYITEFASGWHSHLAQLAAQLAGEPRPPFWATHLRLLAEYEELRSSAFPS